MSTCRSSVPTKLQLQSYEKAELIEMITALQSINDKRLNELEGYAALRNTVKAFLARQCDEVALRRVLSGVR